MSLGSMRHKTGTSQGGFGIDDRLLSCARRSRKRLGTNHFGFGASTIAAIYKDRWQVELFFKALKQNLKIKTFIGTSANAVKTQVWTALIAMLILRYLQLKSKFAWSLSNLVALLRMNLFTYRDLWAWLDEPFGTPPPSEALPQQQLLAFA